MEIRVAQANDIDAIASVHIQSWRETYKGIVLDEVLDGLNMPQKIAQWTHILKQQEEHGNGQILVASIDGKIVGFAHFSKERTGHYDIDGELTTIYILKEYHRTGIGTALFRQGLDYLQSHSFKSMLVWVLADNPFKLFYESFQPVEADRQKFNIGTKVHEEIAYAWRDLSKLIERVG
ncbi:L-amino acid N-acyltransferase YncA [Bacillus oleivorans]|uniref:L-amino acid N-acyltransferase YncA n=1 Tax=Bacillus oleivorans TaxID=1448271 RepID=A0A285CVX4_9BACI|nr:GNAT family N-acetyltransferase [Bacillus oleivorans]SNX71208.1 L-amino acid N-acyltransferase YncA [Bacillus oleivorans]